MTDPLFVHYKEDINSENKTIRVSCNFPHSDKFIHPLIRLRCIFNTIITSLFKSHSPYL